MVYIIIYSTYDANTYIKQYFSWSGTFDKGSTNIVCSSYSGDITITASNQFIFINGYAHFPKPSSVSNPSNLPYFTLNYSIPNSQAVSDSGIDLGFCCFVCPMDFGGNCNDGFIIIYKNYIKIWVSLSMSSSHNYEFMFHGSYFKYS